MRILVFISSFLLLFLSVLTTSPAEIVELTPDNFEETLKSTPVLMVKFFAPWCEHCKAFEPEYEKAAQILKAKGKSYVLAEVNGGTHSSLVDKYEVQSFPTVKLFVNGTANDFDGDRTAQAVVDFIERILGPPSTELKTAADVRDTKTAGGLKVKSPK